MSSVPQSGGPAPIDNANSRSEWQKKTLEFHLDIGKTLILAISVLVTISLSFVSIKGLSSVSGLGQILAGVGLLAVLFSLVLVAVANNKVLSISKKLAETRFKDATANQQSSSDYWDSKIYSATTSTNWALYIFIPAILLLGISSLMLFRLEKSVAELFFSLSRELEATKRMSPPLSWESVAHDRTKEVYDFVVVDSQNNKISCEVDAEGKINHCRP
jgi:hypothetical protein